MKDYYDILGVSRNASGEEIKKAYRSLAHKHHPDKKGGDEAHFKEINEAYHILSDSKKRSDYDKFGRVFSGAGDTGGGFDFYDFTQGKSGAFEDFDLGDIFENFFGFNQGTRKKTRRGRDISIDLEINFEEAVFGRERRVLITKLSRCDDCYGSGAEKNSDTDVCSICQGSGTIRETKRSFFGAFTNLKECDKCRGTGRVARVQCKICKGEGILKGGEEIIINIPAGIENGEMIKLSGKGEATAGGINGDLYVKIHVLSHPYFQREGSNLIMNLKIPVSEALLGADKEIKTLEGTKIKVKIPQGIDPAQILRIKGKGIPSQYKGGRGDLLIKIHFQMPRKISKKAKNLIEDLKNEGI